MRKDTKEWYEKKYKEYLKLKALKLKIDEICDKIYVTRTSLFRIISYGKGKR